MYLFVCICILQVVCQDLAQLNLPELVSMPDEFTEGNTGWQVTPFGIFLNSSVAGRPRA